jgi:polyphosphate glucokinase
MQLFGIDIGGSGIKGAPVDLVKGELATERYRIPTPQPSIPDAVGDVVAEIVSHFGWHGAVGCTFPAVVKNGVTYSAANVDNSWIRFDAKSLLEQKLGRSVVLINDADAAGIAEMEYGAGQGQMGTVIMLTFGTGIGSAVFVDGKLVPNTEFGHLDIRGKDAEDRASDRIRQKKELDWKQWAKRINEFLSHLDTLFSPDIYIIGGGISKKHKKFLRYLRTTAEVVPAQLLNNAGIVGAALAARYPTLVQDDFAPHDVVTD